MPPVEQGLEQRDEVTDRIKLTSQGGAERRRPALLREIFPETTAVQHRASLL
jgi:hypothetical protein